MTTRRGNSQNGLSHLGNSLSRDTRTRPPSSWRVRCGLRLRCRSRLCGQSQGSSSCNLIHQHLKQHSSGRMRTPRLQRSPEGPVHKVLWPDLAACPGSPASNWAARAARSKIPVPVTVRPPSPGTLQPLADRSGAAAPPLRQEAEGLCNNPPATLLARRQTSAACAFRAAVVRQPHSSMPRLVMRTHHALNLPGRRTGPATSR